MGRTVFPSSNRVTQEDEYEIIQVDNDLFGISIPNHIQYLFEYFGKLRKSDAVILYFTYLNIAKEKNGNSNLIYNTKKLQKRLNWGRDKIKNARKILIEYSLITHEKRFNEKGRIKYWIIRLLSFSKSKKKPPTGIPVSGQSVIQCNFPFKNNNLDMDATHKKPSTGIPVDNYYYNNNNPKVSGKNSRHSLKEKNNKKIAKNIINKLNKISSKNFRHSPTSLKPIIARLNDGYTRKDCLKVLTIKWKDPDFDKKYYQPSTLFRPSNFENYLNQSKNISPINNYDKEFVQIFKKYLDNPSDKNTNKLYQNIKQIEDYFNKIPEGIRKNPIFEQLIGQSGKNMLNSYLRWLQEPDQHWITNRTPSLFDPHNSVFNKYITHFKYNANLEIYIK